MQHLTPPNNNVQPTYVMVPVQQLMFALPNNPTAGVSVIGSPQTDFQQTQLFAAPAPGQTQQQLGNTRIFSTGTFGQQVVLNSGGMQAVVPSGAAAAATVTNQTTAIPQMNKVRPRSQILDNFAASSTPPCSHNTWTVFERRKRLCLMECPVCRAVWKTRLRDSSRCKETKCSGGAACGSIHTTTIGPCYRLEAFKMEQEQQPMEQFFSLDTIPPSPSSDNSSPFQNTPQSEGLDLPPQFLLREE